MQKATFIQDKIKKEIGKSTIMFNIMNSKKKIFKKFFWNMKNIIFNYQQCNKNIFIETVLDGRRVIH